MSSKQLTPACVCDVRTCLAHHIGYSENAVVGCPFNNGEYRCLSTLQDREIRAVCHHFITFVTSLIYCASMVWACVLRKEDADWVKECMEYEVGGPRPKRTWREVVKEDSQARKLNKEDAMDGSKWRKLINDV